MRICVAQASPVKGDVARNIANHKRLIELAVANRADLVVFPELSITGYEPTLARDLATTPDDRRFDDLQDLADAHRITIGVGVPLRHEAGITISMVLFRQHQSRWTYSKRYLHADEEPFFLPGQGSVGLVDGPTKIALAICYEISVPEHAEDAAQSGAKVYLASVVKSAPQTERALTRLAEVAAQYAMTVLMVNSVGRSEDYPCGGRSSIWNSKGELVGQLDGVHEAVLVFDTGTQAVSQQIA